ncbi:MAG TPA: gamma carbonic anhydrase family protein [Bdellovibrionales bacterium]|nr:gamma carbonic anhydrase family protein [Bdellovibrionales bacterium]
MIQTVRGKTPVIGEDTYIHPTATLIGDVRVGKRCSIWPNVVIRGDVHSIEIADEANIQDGTIIHATYQRCGTFVGPRVSVGHGVILHGCRVEEASLIGMGCVIMDLAVIPKHSLVGAGSLVTENATFPEGHLILGRPAKAVRKLTPDEIERLEQSCRNYLLYKTWYENETEPASGHENAQPSLKAASSERKK